MAKARHRAAALRKRAFSKKAPKNRLFIERLHLREVLLKAALP
jgi:hypothetical protein